MGVGYKRDEHVILLNCENASWPRPESLLVLYFRLDPFLWALSLEALYFTAPSYP